MLTIEFGKNFRNVSTAGCESFYLSYLIGSIIFKIHTMIISIHPIIRKLTLPSNNQ